LGIWAGFLPIPNGDSTMSILAAPQYITDLCEQYDAYEYSICILVTFPDGKRIITQSAELANAMQANGAETVHITELGE